LKGKSRVAAKEKRRLITHSDAPTGADRRLDSNPTARAVGYFLDATPWLGDFIVLRAKGQADSNTTENVEEPFSPVAEQQISAESFQHTARLSDDNSLGAE